MVYTFFIMIKFRQTDGFTLIEVIIIIVTLGLLATVAVVKYQDLSDEAKASACDSALAQMRSAISIYYSDRAVKTGYAQWPELDSMRMAGVVMQFSIPPNPFQADDKAPDSIVEGVTPGVTVGDRGGWAYKPSTGEIWANTSTEVPESGCSPPRNNNENEW